MFIWLIKFAISIKYTYKNDYCSNIVRLPVYESDTQCISYIGGAKLDVTPLTPFTGDIKAKRYFTIGMAIEANPVANLILCQSKESHSSNLTFPNGIDYKNYRVYSDRKYTKFMAIKDSDKEGYTTTEYQYWNKNDQVPVTKTFLNGAAFKVKIYKSTNYNWHGDIIGKLVPLEDAVINLLGVTDYRIENVN